MEELLDGESEKLTRKAVEMVLAGDMAALRLCLDRTIPPRKDRPVLFALPPARPKTDAKTEQAIRAARAQHPGRGIIKLAKQFGVGVSVVQRVLAA